MTPDRCPSCHGPSRICDGPRIRRGAVLFRKRYCVRCGTKWATCEFVIDSERAVTLTEALLDVDIATAVLERIPPKQHKIAGHRASCRRPHKTFGLQRAFTWEVAS